MPKWLGPFEVMEIHQNAYQLHFPDSICVHPAINISFLKPVISILPSDPPWAVKASIVCDDVYEVNEVVDHQKKGQQ